MAANKNINQLQKRPREWGREAQHVNAAYITRCAERQTIIDEQLFAREAGVFAFRASNGENQLRGYQSASEPHQPIDRRGRRT
jgi:hypothetical protein